RVRPPLLRPEQRRGDLLLRERGGNSRRVRRDASQGIHDRDVAGSGRQECLPHWNDCPKVGQTFLSARERSSHPVTRPYACWADSSSAQVSSRLSRRSTSRSSPSGIMNSSSTSSPASRLRRYTSAHSSALHNC